jgi:hypothetical protein
LFKRFIGEDRSGVGVADFAAMSAWRHKVIGSASMAAKLWIWSRIAFLKEAAGISVVGGKGVAQLALAFREFVAPRYRPELHYMRGPGPASARRVSSPKAGLHPS